MSEAAAALRELLDPGDEAIKGTTAYLAGQLAAELIASASDAELSQLIVDTHQQSSSADQQDVPTARQALLSLVSGLLQGVLSGRQSAGRTVSPLTVREHVLNLLAIEPHNPASLATEIGCSPATASRALRRLHDAGLVENAAKSPLADGRHVLYQLTSEGEQRQDDHFFGRLGDGDEVTSEEEEVRSESESEEVGAGYDYGEPLERLTQVTAQLNEHDPGLARRLYPALDALKDHVDDPALRAAAVSEMAAFHA